MRKSFAYLFWNILLLVWILVTSVSLFYSMKSYYVKIEWTKNCFLAKGKTHLESSLDQLQSAILYHYCFNVLPCGCSLIHFHCLRRGRCQQLNKLILSGGKFYVEAKDSDTFQKLFSNKHSTHSIQQDAISTSLKFKKQGKPNITHPILILKFSTKEWEKPIKFLNAFLMEKSLKLETINSERWILVFYGFTSLWLCIKTTTTSKKLKKLCNYMKNLFFWNWCFFFLLIS